MLDALLRPASVAVVGASRTSGKVGHAVLQNLIEGGFEGEIHPVNPGAEEILGLRCHPNLKGLRDRGWSLPRIAKRLGRADHGTIHHLLSTHNPDGTRKHKEEAND